MALLPPHPPTACFFFPSFGVGNSGLVFGWQQSVTKLYLQIHFLLVCFFLRFSVSSSASVRFFIFECIVLAELNILILES